ncbi:hypothetical protein RUND412_007523 [Rhizina undulata]
MTFKVSNKAIILDNLPRFQPHHHPNDTLPADSPLFTHILPSIAEVPRCGPLLRYIGTSYTNPSKPIWRGSVMIITEYDEKVPQLELYNGMEENEEEMSQASTKGVKIHENSYRRRRFWRHGLEMLLAEKEKKVTYCIFGEKGQLRRSSWVPGREESMRILFYSCNGFSVGINEASFSGPALWNDVLQMTDGCEMYVAGEYGDADIVGAGELLETEDEGVALEFVGAGTVMIVEVVPDNY